MLTKEKQKASSIKYYQKNKEIIKAKAKEKRKRIDAKQKITKLTKENSDMKERLKVIKEYYLEKDKKLPQKFCQIKNNIDHKSFLKKIFCNEYRNQFVYITTGNSVNSNYLDLVWEKKPVLIFQTKNISTENFEEIYEKEKDAHIPFFSVFVAVNNALNRYECSKQTQVVLF